MPICYLEILNSDWLKFAFYYVKSSGPKKMLGKLVQVLQAGGRVNRSAYVKRGSARRYRSSNGVPQSKRLGSNP